MNAITTFLLNLLYLFTFIATMMFVITVTYPYLGAPLASVLGVLAALGSIGFWALIAAGIWAIRDVFSHDRPAGAWKRFLARQKANR